MHVLTQTNRLRTLSSICWFVTENLDLVVIKSFLNRISQSAVLANSGFRV